MKTHLQILVLLLSLSLFLSAEMNAQALTGNKVIGPSKDYTSLGAAVTDINTKGVTGTLTLLIDSDLTEPGSLEITTTTLTGSNKLVIKPNAAKTPVVSFTAVATSGNKGNAGIAITGATTNVGNITFDGSNTTNGTTRDMTFALNDGTNGRYVFRFNGEADDITIKNLKIVGTAFMATTASGSRTYGVYCSATAAGAQDRLTVNNCEIGSNTSAFYYAIYKPDGGTLAFGSNLTVSNNILFAQHKGLSVWGSDGISNINNNTISIVGHPTGAYVQNSINGIYVESWKAVVNVFNNKIITLKAKALNQTSAKHLYGIIVYYAPVGNSGSIANIYNNFISDFSYTGDNSTQVTYPSEVIGIVADAGDVNTTVNIYYNSIYMSGITTNPVYGMRVYDDANQSVNIKNNIVVNTVDQNNSYAIYVDPITNNCLKTSDYNDFVVTGANANIGYYNGAKYNTLANWKTITTKDANSININPANPFGGAGQWTSITNLHWVSRPSVSFAGNSITGITSDIDGEIRNTAKPYMGADEGTTPLSIKIMSTELPHNFVLNQNYPNPFNPETEITFSLKTPEKTSLKIYDMLGKEVTTLIDKELASGSYSVKFNAINISSGMYIYRLTAGSFSASKQMILSK